MYTSLDIIIRIEKVNFCELIFSQKPQLHFHTLTHLHFSKSVIHRHFQLYSFLIAIIIDTIYVCVCMDESDTHDA